MNTSTHGLDLFHVPNDFAILGNYVLVSDRSFSRLFVYGLFWFVHLFTSSAAYTALRISTRARYASSCVSMYPFSLSIKR